MKYISILGSTGSIGTSTLDVIKNCPDNLKVAGLTANKNAELLVQQAIKFRPEIVAVMDSEKAKFVSSKLKGQKIEVARGIEGLIKVASFEKANLVVSGIVGSAGLIPAMAAIEAGHDIALASKETLVMAGDLILNEAKKRKVKIIPIDSEHNAIFQCLKNIKKEHVKNIILTASGGPFLNLDKKLLSNVSPKETIEHPRWKMGIKISVDSATLMNKGFEVIEARYLFNIGFDKIKVLIHPESIVHGLVELIDGNFMAVLSKTDMRIPIQYALTYPERKKGYIPSLDINSFKNLSFQEPDLEKFPCLSYAYQAGLIGGTMPAVLNAANETAVNSFLKNKIKFTDISRIIKTVMDKHDPVSNPNLEQILNADLWAGKESKKLCF
ncbi:MAG: 1-deoxy-D-xylulose-5-phosphate reductoisomerase [bacterium]